MASAAPPGPAAPEASDAGVQAGAACRVQRRQVSTARVMVWFAPTGSCSTKMPCVGVWIAVQQLKLAVKPLYSSLTSSIGAQIIQVPGR